MRKKKVVEEKEKVIIKQINQDYLFKGFCYVWRHKKSNNFAIMHISNINGEKVDVEAEEFIFNMPKPKYCIRKEKLYKIKTRTEVCGVFNRQLGKEPEKSFYEVWVFDCYKDAEDFILNEITKRYEVSPDNIVNY